MIWRLAGAALVLLLVTGRAEALTCPAMPYTFTNGTIADANQVNADFASLLTCSNTLLAPLASPALTGNISMAGVTTFPTLASVPLAQWSMNVNSYPAAGLIPAGVLEGVRIAIVTPPTYTQAPWPVTMYSGYCDMQNNTGVGATCVPFFSLAANEGGPTGAVYHSNGIITNAPPQFAVSGTGHGLNYGALIGTEINPNVWTKAAAGVPTGDVDAYRAVGGGDVNPTGVTVAYHAFGFSFNTIPWGFGFKGQDACCVTGVDLGALAVAAPSINSQGINFHAYNSASANITATIQHAATGGLGGTLQTSVPASGGFNWLVNNGTIFDYGVTTAATWSSPQPWTLSNATIKMTALPASAGAGGVNVCIDNVGVLYKKAACP